jgi:hypothetical protein
LGDTFQLTVNPLSLRYPAPSPGWNPVFVATFKALPGATQVMKSQSVVPLGCGYSAVIGHWEISFKDAGGKMQTASVRTSEILKKQGNKTLYVVDHASVALPPPSPETTPAPEPSQ